MSAGSAPMWWGLSGVAVAALVVVPLVAGDDDDGAAGFDGYIQSGTCALPSDEFVAALESEVAHAVEPYVAVGGDGAPVTLGYYGAPELPGFSVALIHTDQQFSMVITESDDGVAVACGDILRPDADQFGEAGLALVQLLPLGSSGVEGVASLERARLQRELDITPTRARIILSTDGIAVPAHAAAGYDGYVQSGQCESPINEFRAESESDDEYDVAPFEAVSSGAATDLVTVAYYGSAGVTGFGLSAAYTDLDFSLVVADPESGQPVACGDILEPEADEFTEAGLALVQLLPTGDAGVQGYAVIDRVTMQRELDVTPTLIRILLFAPPATDT